MKHTKVNEKFININLGDNRNVSTIFWKKLLAVHHTVNFQVAYAVELGDRNVVCELIAVIKASPLIKYN